MIAAPVREYAAGVGAKVIVVDSERADAPSFQPPEIDITAPAYLQYTSGSTRTPAGAVVTHAAIAANVAQAQAAFGIESDWTMVGWLPFFHDMGLVLLVCIPALLNLHAVYTQPFMFVQHPARWLRALSSNRKVMTAAPNFAYELCVQRITDEERGALDLSQVKVAINGAEPVRASTVENFQRIFAASGWGPTAMRPSYGLAEATVFVSTVPADAPARITAFDREALLAGEAKPAPDTGDAIRIVSAGRPAGQHVAVVDPATGTPRADGELGEIWINGPNVASGYWQNSERSQEDFGGELSGGVDSLPAQGWLRTGDQGTYVDGELYITGRLKDLIIVDGKNHYPHDIEDTASDAHPAVRTGRVAAFGITSDSGEEIVMVLERARTEEAALVPEDEIQLAVRRAVAAAHDLKLRDVHVLSGQKVMLTSSGKIARAANRTRYLEERAA